MKKEDNIELTLTKCLKNHNLQWLKNRIASLSINEDLIALIESTLQNITEVEKKILFLHYIKKLIIQIPRPVNEGHFSAFQEDYRRDRINFDPVTWIDSELGFLTALRNLNIETPTDYSVDPGLGTHKPLLKQNDIQKVYKMSRSTLNRRIAQGMPCYPNGGSKFFDVDEVNEWLKIEKSA